MNRENGLALDKKEEDKDPFADLLSEDTQHITTLLGKSSKIGYVYSSSIHFQIMTSFTICR